MANITSSIKNWSTTDASNQPDSTDSATIVGDMRAIQSAVRYLYTQDTIASATTCDLGSKDAESLTISGTTTITGLGTVSAGIRKICTFSGALTLTHNATSLILPGGANITTVAGDLFEFESLGSGNWKCTRYLPITGGAVTTSNTATLTNKTLTSPVLTNPSFSGTTDDLGTVTTADINGGSIDGATVGASSASSGAFTTITASTSILSSGSGGVGYATGAGGTVTQATSKTTTVTINKPSGQITTHAASLAAGATVLFFVANTTVGANGTVTAHHISPYGGTYKYRVEVIAPGSSGFVVSLKNETGGALAEAVVISFNVHLGSTT